MSTLLLATRHGYLVTWDVPYILDPISTRTQPSLISGIDPMRPTGTIWHPRVQLSSLTVLEGVVAAAVVVVLLQQGCMTKFWHVVLLHSLFRTSRMRPIK